MENLFFIIFIKSFLIVLTHSENCSIANSINITNSHRDGLNFIHKSVVYKPEDYFNSTSDYNYHTNEIVTVDKHLRGCLCNIVDCVRFCCDIDFIEQENSNGNKCVYHNQIMNQEYKKFVSDYGVIIGKPCNEMVKFDIHEFKIHYNGILELVEANLNYTHHDYCISPTQNKTHDIQLVVYICSHKFGEVDDDYYEESIDEKMQTKFKIYPYALIISVMFLFIIIVIYAILPELRNIHGKCVLCYVCGLFISYIILIFLHLKGHVQNHSLCVFIGFSSLSSIIYSFMWLNAMCVDIFWTFKGITGSKKVSDKKKFIFYLIYTTTITFFVFSFALIMQLSDAKYNPNIGKNNCWIIQEWKTELIFLYLPIIILLIINITLFTITALTIRKLQNEISVAIKRGGSTKHTLNNEKNTFSLYLRLFIIMGATWIFDIITWIIEKLYGVHWISYIPDLCNALQGLLIFIFVVWKPNVKKLLIKRFNKYRGKKIYDIKTERSTSSKYSETLSSFEEIQLKNQKYNFTSDN